VSHEWRGSTTGNAIRYILRNITVGIGQQTLIAVQNERHLLNAARRTATGNLE
jgi:hypothetical protein